MERSRLSRRMDYLISRNWAGAVTDCSAGLPQPWCQTWHSFLPRLRLDWCVSSLHVGLGFNGLLLSWFVDADWWSPNWFCRRYRNRLTAAHRPTRSGEL